ncbi:MAG: hypothetical protein M1822_007701 [Bathelium mastoideum]|nr:MAG: hypothetical protein M1822_007701 [Bathelium mastoideum]
MTLLGRKTKQKDVPKASVQPPVFQSVSHPAASQTTLNLSSSPRFSSVLPPPYNPADFQWTGPPETFYRQPATVSASQPCLPQRKLIPHRPKPKKQNPNVKSTPSSANLLNVPTRPTPQPNAAVHSSTSLAVSSGPSRGVQANNKPQEPSARPRAQDAALYDQISVRFNDVITSMDEQSFAGDERDLYIRDPQPPNLYSISRGQPEAAAGTVSYSSNHFAKVWLYANSRLPPYLPPLKLYLPTYPLLCLAAQFSEKAYSRALPPSISTSEEVPTTHLIPADWRRNTKAMVLSAVAIDDANTLVLAIRGSHSFRDWAVNFRPAPQSPHGFLDDAGNLCHSGFLGVARAMAGPVAGRLAALVQANPSRRAYSLLVCGHSAGGAVAALLFAHMLARSDEVAASELRALVPRFRRVHCVTFGAPPVSLLPLQKPAGERWKKSLFFAFVNEGDPVARADKQVVGSLLRLYASPAPGEVKFEVPATTGPAQGSETKRKPLANAKESNAVGKAKKMTTPQMPVWKLPPSTLSNAGRLVLLRTEKKANGEERVQACVTTDEQLREVVFGDPICHSMTLYAKRIETLATQAVTVKMP